LADIKRDPKFAKALYAEAVNALLEGETDEGLSMLRDLVHAGITFKELSKQTGLGEKALHRMLSRRAIRPRATCSRSQKRFAKVWASRCNSDLRRKSRSLTVTN